MAAFFQDPARPLYPRPRADSVSQGGRRRRSSLERPDSSLYVDGPLSSAPGGCRGRVSPTRWREGTAGGRNWAASASNNFGGSSTNYVGFSLAGLGGIGQFIGSGGGGHGGEGGRSAGGAHGGAGGDHGGAGAGGDHGREGGG